jgi:hypothetical protein
VALMWTGIRTTLRLQSLPKNKLPNPLWNPAIRKSVNSKLAYNFFLFSTVTGPCCVLRWITVFEPPRVIRCPSIRTFSWQISALQLIGALLFSTSTPELNFAGSKS